VENNDRRGLMAVIMMGKNVGRSNFGERGSEGRVMRRTTKLTSTVDVLISKF